MNSPSIPLLITGKQIRVRGLVQGVGFRPTVWRLAVELGITGQVSNDGEGVLIEAHASSATIDQFINLLNQQCPPLARIDSITMEDSQNPTPDDFCIVKSDATETHTGIVADAASCASCIKETLDNKNRRYQYPFTNCTHCGPRLSIIKAIPYDRINTSMRDFTLCSDCQAEYENPADRRFHAQPNACPECGPKIWLEPAVDNDESIIKQTQSLLEQGKIIAIKGISGFHLACDATNQVAVSRLRTRKDRYAKPFAVMAKSVSDIQSYCFVDEVEKEVLHSTAAPIVLLNKKKNNLLCDAVAPKQNTLGFLLPYTPLHHLLLNDLAFPLVMTSGNPSDVPQSISNEDALTQLTGIADYVLLNNRDIVNRVDDSVVRVVDKQVRVLRRARGYAPSAFSLPDGFENTPDLLACGSELKNTFCLVKDQQAILSQHMGDLENAATYADYEKNRVLYQQLYQHQPSAIATDAHPEYLSGKYGQQLAEQNQLPLIKVPHHHAHIAACLADNNWSLNQGKVLGIALDGLGYGEDDSLWGGEFLLADYHSCQRLSYFKPVALLGGMQAMLQPWRNTYAQLLSHFSWQELTDRYGDLELIHYLQEKPVKTLDAMLKNKLNTPLASSCGRLFDAVAASLNICREQTHYEGQAAIEMEQLVTPALLSEEKDNAYRLTINGDAVLNIGTASLWNAILTDLSKGIDNAVVATRFHIGLANVIVNMIKELKKSALQENSRAIKSINTIALSGGVFQNKILFELVSEQLIRAKYQVLSHSKIPANDGGIALGQALIASAQLIKKQEINLCA